MKLTGSVWRFGNDIDTDVIIPARHLNTTDPEELAKHCMEDADASFAPKVKQGDIIVAGKNFGCGSSREHAPIAIKAAGVSCVIAGSFARIFYRNAINIGLPIFECSTADSIKEGDVLEIDAGRGVIYNKTQDKSYQCDVFPEFIQNIVNTGGLIAYINSSLAEKTSAGE